MNSEFRCIKMSCLCSMRRRLTEFGWNRTQWRGWETPRSPDHRPLTCLSSSVTLCVVLGRTPISWWVCMTPSSANSSGQNCTEFLIMSSLSWFTYQPCLIKYIFIKSCVQYALMYDMHYKKIGWKILHFKKETHLKWNFL